MFAVLQINLSEMKTEKGCVTFLHFLFIPISLQHLIAVKFSISFQELRIKNWGDLIV